MSLKIWTNLLVELRHELFRQEDEILDDHPSRVFKNMLFRDFSRNLLRELVRWYRMEILRQLTHPCKVIPSLVDPNAPHGLRDTKVGTGKRALDATHRFAVSLDENPCTARSSNIGSTGSLASRLSR